MLYTSCLHLRKLIKYHTISNILDGAYMGVQLLMLLIIVYANLLYMTHFGILYSVVFMSIYFQRLQSKTYADTYKT